MSPEKGEMELRLGQLHPFWDHIIRTVTRATVPLPAFPHVEMFVEVGGVRQRFLLAHHIDVEQLSEAEETVYVTRWRMVDDDDDG